MCEQLGWAVDCARDRLLLAGVEVSSWSEALYSVCCDWTQMWTVKYSGTSSRIAFPLLRGCHDKMPNMHRAHKRLLKVWVILYFQRSPVWISSCCVICWVMCMLKHGSKIRMWPLSLSKLLELERFSPHHSTRRQYLFGIAWKGAFKYCRDLKFKLGRWTDMLVFHWSSVANYRF